MADRCAHGKHTHTHTGKTKLNTCIECFLKIWLSTLNNRFSLNSAVGDFFFLVVMGNIKWASQVSVCLSAVPLCFRYATWLLCDSDRFPRLQPLKRRHRAATLFRSHGVAMFTFSHFICNEMIFNKRWMVVIIRSLEVGVRSCSRPPSTHRCRCPR